MSIEWEYKYVVCNIGPYWDELYELYLKSFGPEGWELVHIMQFPNIYDDGKIHVKAYFKRRKMLLNEEARNETAY